MSDISINILSGEGQTGSKVNLPAAIFGGEVNVPLIHQVVVAQLAAARQGTHATKTRGQVSGGGIKPWRQKGTGRARQGSRRAPQWTGGGTVFGPQPRSYAQRTPKKMIAAALRSVLSDRVGDGKFFVVESIVEGATPSTRQALQSLAGIGGYRSAVVVLHRDEDVAWLSLRNVPNVHAIAVDQLNVYDVVANEVTVFTKSALSEFVSRYGIAELAEDEAPKTKPKKAAKAEPVEAAEVAEPVVEVDEAAEPVAPAKPKRTTKAKAVTEAEVTEAAAEPVAEVAEEEPVAPAKPKRTAKAVKAPEPLEAPVEADAKEAPDYGPGSYRGTTPPEGFDIKGNEDSMLFHTPESQWYSQTIAEVWFNTPEAAEQAGFTNVMEQKK